MFPSSVVRPPDRQFSQIHSFRNVSLEAEELHRLPLLPGDLLAKPSWERSLRATRVLLLSRFGARSTAAAAFGVTFCHCPQAKQGHTGPVTQCWCSAHSSFPNTKHRGLLLSRPGKPVTQVGIKGGFCRWSCWGLWGKPSPASEAAMKKPRRGGHGKLYFKLGLLSYMAPKNNLLCFIVYSCLSIYKKFHFSQLSLKIITSTALNMNLVGTVHHL